jgi:hypothetical protein
LLGLLRLRLRFLGREGEGNGKGDEDDAHQGGSWERPVAGGPGGRRSIRSLASTCWPGAVVPATAASDDVAMAARLPPMVARAPPRTDNAPVGGCSQPAQTTDRQQR